MKEQILSYHQSQIQYNIIGNGTDVVIAFHGYGEVADSFNILEDCLPAHLTIFAITLPLHGNTTWKQNNYFTPQDVLSIIEQILKENNFPSDTFSIAGYSLGGRICLKLLEKYPGRINHTLLLAPDGIKMFLLQYLATQNIFSKQLFTFTIRHPQWFLTLIKTIKTLRLVNPSVADFVYRLMADKEERTTLYNRWMMFKYLHPQIDKVKENIISNNKRVDIIIGQYDKLIKPSTIDGLKKGMDDAHITIHRIPTGHILMKEKFAQQIASLL